MNVKVVIMVGWAIALWATASWSATRVDFNGQISFDRQELTLALNVPALSTIEKTSDRKAVHSVSAKTNELNDDQYHMLLKLDHLKARSYDLATELDTSLDVKKIPDSVDQFISGKLRTQYTFLDLKPVRDSSGEF